MWQFVISSGRFRSNFAVLAVILFVPLAFGEMLDDEQIKELQPKQIIKREMAGAQTHRYKFDLQTNEFFQVRVEQKGVDVALKLLDASGNVLATMDSPNGKQGPEILSFVAEKAGSFVLEVSTLNAKAEKGSYTIIREAPRTATVEDRRRVEIEHMFVEGITARDTEGQADIAIAKLEEALKGWQDLEDSYLAELAGRNVEELKENKYFATFNKLFQELQKAGEVLDEGQKLSFRSKADSLSARAKLNEALAMYRALETKVDDKVFVEKIKQASEVSQRPLNLLKNLQFFVKSGEIACLERIAQTHFNLGEWQEYIDYKNLSLAGYQEIIADKSLNPAIKPQNLVKIRILEAQALGGIGDALYSHFGRTEEALNYLNQALERFQALYQENHDPQIKLLEAKLLRSIGFSYGKEARNNTQAIDFFTRSLEVFRSIHDKKEPTARRYRLARSQPCRKSCAMLSMTHGRKYFAHG